MTNYSPRNAKFVNRRTRNTGAELPVELGMKAGQVTKIRYRRVCEKLVDLLVNLGTHSKVTIYTYSKEPMHIVGGTMGFLS
jgi:hypothetical protein